MILDLFVSIPLYHTFFCPSNLGRRQGLIMEKTSYKYEVIHNTLVDSMGLLHMNPPVVMNIKKIRRLMKKYNLFCPIRKANPYRRMAKAIKTSNYADNLLQREFECYGPRYVLLTDITYIPYNGKFAYLSTILDAYTKQILAYVLSGSLEIDFVKEIVENLIRDHGISLHKETLIHSDQGSHYTSTTFIQIIEDYDLRRSMSRRGNC